MIGELQAAKDFLESEGERVQREAEHYTTLTQMASASVKIISDILAGWREAGHPLRDHSRSSQGELDRLYLLRNGRAGMKQSPPRVDTAYPFRMSDMAWSSISIHRLHATILAAT